MHERALFTPIRWRLVGWTLLIVSLILALLGTSIYLTQARSLVDQVDRSLASQSDPGQAFPFLFGGRDGQRSREGYRGGVFYLALDPHGTVRANPQQVQLDDLSVPAPTERAITFATITLNGELTRIAVRGTPDGGTLVVGQSLAPEAAALASLVVILLGGGGLGLLLSLGGAWFLAGRALLPIQQAFRRQQEFVADASHELRTPLTVLRSATDLLNRHRDQRLSEQGELFEDVQAEIRRMERLVADLLTVARSDRGELELMTAEVDLARLAADVARRIRPIATDRGIELELDTGHRFARQRGNSESECTQNQAPLAVVTVDPERMQQVLFILLDNAIKYTPSGGHIKVRVESDAHSALLEIADDGPGIAPEHLPRIFDRFYRADKARSRAAGGTGLGLTIAKLLVDAHDGELALHSQLGHGTVASVRLPLAENHKAFISESLRKLQGSISKVIATS
jgi:two-component system sensor histidine kinase CiaH